jgi:hypothetical protein
MKLIERFLTIARQRHSGVQIDLNGWKTQAINVGYIVHARQCRLLT